MSVKGGVYAHETYEAKKHVYVCFCIVNAWDRHRLYKYTTWVSRGNLRKGGAEKAPLGIKWGGRSCYLLA